MSEDKEQHKLSVESDPPNIRKHYRIQEAINIIIDGSSFKTDDWSVGGFKINTIDNKVEFNDCAEVTIIIPFQDYNIQFVQQINVIRHDPEQSILAAEFINVSEGNRQLLEYFASRLISGDMTTIDDVIHHIDIPVSTLGSYADPSPSRQVAKRKKITSMLIGTGYFTAGTVIALYVGIAIYSNFFRLQVDTAVVTTPIESVDALYSGWLDKLYVQVGDTVNSNSPLFRIANPDIIEELEKSKIAIQESTVALKYAKDSLKSEQQRLDLYRDIGEKLKVSAQAELASAKEDMIVANNNQQRLRDLFDKGMTSKSSLEEAQAQKTRLQSAFNIAKTNLSISEAAVDAVKSGRFFTGDKLEGSVPELQDELNNERQKFIIEQERLSLAKEQYDKLLIKAPYPGKVVKIMKSQGNTFDRGNPLVLIEKFDDLIIDAYLTQDEVTQIGLKKPVIIFSPATGNKYHGHVLRIDRTAGFIDEMESKFSWRANSDRSANVKIAINDEDQQAAATDLTAGLPIVVSFKRETANYVYHSLVSLLKNS